MYLSLIKFTSCFLLLVLLCCINSVVTLVRVKIVTWNAADNQYMDGHFTNEAIDTVLGLESIKSAKEIPDIYAIGLQQVCWMCNKKNLPKIGKRFLSRINKGKGRSMTYEVVCVNGLTKLKCEEKCTLGSHGTLVSIIIAIKGLVTGKQNFQESDKCGGKSVPNFQPGILGTKVDLGTKSLCFGHVHLHPKEMRAKKMCIRSFLKLAQAKAGWLIECDAHFLFGDFNTKTGERKQGAEMSGIHLPNTTNFKSLKKRDQMGGVLPFGTDKSSKGSTRNIICYINFIQKIKFDEGTLNFMPTYYIEASKDMCDDQFPCYSSSEPISWTDRIIHTSGKRNKYDAVYVEYGPHLPVFGEFELFRDEIEVMDSRKSGSFRFHI